MSNFGPEEQLDFNTGDVSNLNPRERRHLVNIAGVCGVLAVGGASLEIADIIMESISFRHAGAFAALCGFVYGATLVEALNTPMQE